MRQERTEIVAMVAQARASGARQSQACEVLDLSAKTLQRWAQPDNLLDGRLEAKHEPRNKLTVLERQRMIKIANEPGYTDLPPGKIVPRLADEGRYIASESSFYRVLKAEHQLQHRQ
jgi:putative transposase